ncbi:MAG: ATP-binding cassette domain-containing protein [Oligoflexia bacterium]|nr:ATP-binding cassette domain-containing protein [Oligoflexia bacterium]
MIQVKGLSKVFRVHQKEAGLKGSIRSLFNRKWLDKWALNDVSFDVKAGEIVGLVGSNGAGKTTLMKLLAGIVHPTSGEAHVLGHIPWERNNDFRRQIALIMGQKAQLWWDLPAADCFLLLKEIYQIPDDLYHSTLDDLTNALQVKKQLNIQVRRLSLGERMKMELVAALLHQPKIVFLDEPTIGLDLAAQKAIREFLLHYRKLHNPAMIVTSHYMEDITRLCERIIIIREGQFIYDGPIGNVAKKFTSHKLISAHLDTISTSTEQTSIASQLGIDVSDVIVQTSELIKVKISRDRIAEVSAQILKLLPVVDLTIEEQDIGEVISSLMRGKKDFL